MSPEDTQRLWNSLQTLQTQQELTLSNQQATNDHLARLNSKVATHEDLINNLLLWKARIEGFTGAINMGWAVFVSAISGIIIYFFTRR